MLAAFAGFAVVAVGLGQVEVPHGWTVWGALLVTGIFASALAFLVQTWAQQRTSATRTALAFAMEPVWAGFFGFWLAGDRLGAIGWGGCALIMAGIVVAEPEAGRTLRRLVARLSLNSGDMRGNSSCDASRTWSSRFRRGVGPRQFRPQVRGRSRSLVSSLPATNAPLRKEPHEALQAPDRCRFARPGIVDPTDVRRQRRGCRPAGRRPRNGRRVRRSRRRQRSRIPVRPRSPAISASIRARRSPALRTCSAPRTSRNGAAQQAKADLRTAYLDAEGRPGAILVAAGALGGRTLAPGLYKDDGAPASLGIATGQTLTLDGDASSVWIFQSASTLIAETGSRVVLTGGAQACNVFWQVGSSATLRTSSTFVGTVMAHTSITAAEQCHGRRAAAGRSAGERRRRLDAWTPTRSRGRPARPTPVTPTPVTPTPRRDADAGRRRRRRRRARTADAEDGAGEARGQEGGRGEACGEEDACGGWRRPASAARPCRL